MVDVASIVKLAFVLSQVPQTVKINRGQCQLLVDRITSLAGHLERMQNVHEKLERSHEECIARAHGVLLECEEFMRSFEDGMWMVKALKREVHREKFSELHESLTYVFQVLHLEIDYHSLKKRSIDAEMRDIAHMEDQLAGIAANLEKLEQSVAALTDESKKHHDDIMAALRNVRVYRQTLGQDQLDSVLATAKEDERSEVEKESDVSASSSPAARVRSMVAQDAVEPPSCLQSSTLECREAKEHEDRKRSQNSIVISGNVSSSSSDRPPKSSIIKSGLAANASTNARTLGSSLHTRLGQSLYIGGRLAVGMVEESRLVHTSSGTESGAGDGGAKRGEYEVSFGEGQMGMSLKNVEARAEVSKVEPGGSAHAAGVRPADSVSGINGRIPLGYTQVMSILPTAPRPVRICFVRGQRTTLSPGSKEGRTHASTWASNAVTAGVHHPAGDRGVLLEMYAKASFSQTGWIRSQGWDGLPMPPPLPGSEKETSKGEAATNESGYADEAPVRHFSGVRVGRGEKVIEIRLPGNDMHGVLPPSVGSLDELRALELRENRLEGNIPESLRYLHKLTKIDLAHNMFEGSVPGGDARWIKSMSVILLNNCRLSGHIPSTLGRLLNLTHLDLSFNALSGSIPPELSAARALEILNVSNNTLNGPLPQTLGGLTRLKILNAANNQLVGPLTKDLGQLTCLEVLSLANNRLSGNIPHEAFSSPCLLMVDMASNGLEGKIPNEICTRLANLTHLDISKNSLSGELPSSIGSICQLKKLNLEKNSMEGALPTSLAECKALEDLNLSNNLLVGPLLHIHWENFYSLEHLLLANNKLEGALPASFGSLASLVSLDISKNQIAGSIPRELHELTGLKLLDISGNKIASSGLLPRTSFFSEKRTLKKKLSACDVRF